MEQNEKKNIRIKIKALKANVSLTDKLKLSEEIFTKLEQSFIFKQAKVVVLYWSMPDEVFTHSFIEKWMYEKTILLPSINGNELELKAYCGLENMINDPKYNIAEPTGKTFKNMNAIDLIVVPGIAFDNKNNRLGRGKGFYDKLLAKCKAPKIGVCFNFQMLTNIPTLPHDIKMNQIIHS